MTTLCDVHDGCAVVVGNRSTPWAWSTLPGVSTLHLRRYWIAPWLVSDRLLDAWGVGWRAFVLSEHRHALAIIRQLEPGPLSTRPRAE